MFEHGQQSSTCARVLSGDWAGLMRTWRCHTRLEPGVSGIARCDVPRILNERFLQCLLTVIDDHGMARGQMGRQGHLSITSPQQANVYPHFNLYGGITMKMTTVLLAAITLCAVCSTVYAAYRCRRTERR
jgi:hypothetical protein